MYAKPVKVINGVCFRLMSNDNDWFVETGFSFEGFGIHLMEMLVDDEGNIPERKGWWRFNNWDICYLE